MVSIYEDEVIRVELDGGIEDEDFFLAVVKEPTAADTDFFTERLLGFEESRRRFSELVGRGFDVYMYEVSRTFEGTFEQVDLTGVYYALMGA